MITDGLGFDHEPKKDNRYRKRTHYDQVWDALKDSDLRMMGDHSQLAGHFTFMDVNGEKVGEVVFDSKASFVSGKFYESVHVSGRIHNQNAAFFDFVRRIEETHARR